jgi:Phage integrase family
VLTPKGSRLFFAHDDTNHTHASLVFVGFRTCCLASIIADHRTGLLVYEAPFRCRDELAASRHIGVDLHRSQPIDEIGISDDLVTLLRSERERHLRIVAGVPDGATVDLSLVKLPAGALVFPLLTRGDKPDLCRPRSPRSVSNVFALQARQCGYKGLRFHDLRGSHGTALLNAGEPIHEVAKRLGHDPATLLAAYAKQTDEATAKLVKSCQHGVVVATIGERSASKPLARPIRKAQKRRKYGVQKVKSPALKPGFKILGVCRYAFVSAMIQAL